jgi:hypothetical protein
MEVVITDQELRAYIPIIKIITLGDKKCL